MFQKCIVFKIINPLSHLFQRNQNTINCQKVYDKINKEYKFYVSYEKSFNSLKMHRCIRIYKVDHFHHFDNSSVK